MSRRDLLAGSVLAGLTAPLVGGRHAQAEPARPARLEARKPARHVIFVLMSGAPSQLETFDPKPGAPTGGPFGTIATGIPGIRFCEYLPRLAKGTDDLAVVRSVTGPAPGGDHLADLRRTLTGHSGQSKVGVVRPAFGSIVSHLLNAADAKLPGYINLSPSWHDGAFQGPGCLGPKYDMLKIPGFGQRPGITARATGVSAQGFASRNALRDELSREFLERRKSPDAQRYEESFARASGLIDSVDVFDLSREPAQVRERYGPTRYAADCLTARRLIEAGVPFVLIQCYGTRCDWDWHYEAFSHLSKYMLGMFDHVTTVLIEDLKQRGLWDETLLICTGEFGRTPQIGSNEANGYAGRAHYGKNYNMFFAGGPIRGGQVVGATNANGTEIVDRPIIMGDLYRTFYSALGINPDGDFVVDGQPIPIQEEGKQTLTELLA